MPVSPPQFKPRAHKTSKYCAKVDREDNRQSAAKRGYDWQWGKTRRLHLIAEPLCVYCAAKGRLTPATEVDHIETIKDAPGLRLDPDNLASTCSDCHKKVTAEYDGSFGRSKRTGKRELATQGKEAIRGGYLPRAATSAPQANRQRLARK